MTNRVSINRKKVLGSYLDSRNAELIPEDASFWAGAFLTVGLPQIIFFIYGGELPLMAFAASALAGSAWGLARYFFPQRLLSCVGVRPAARIPPREDALLKKAA